MSTPIVQLEDFKKTYQSGDIQVHAVRGVNLTVQAGEFIAVMGASGSGKSTLMNTVGCLDRPSGGRFMLDGVEVSKLDRDQLADRDPLAAASCLAFIRADRGSNRLDGP